MLGWFHARNCGGGGGAGDEGERGLPRRLEHLWVALRGLRNPRLGDRPRQAPRRAPPGRHPGHVIGRPGPSGVAVPADETGACHPGRRNPLRRHQPRHHGVALRRRGHAPAHQNHGRADLADPSLLGGDLGEPDRSVSQHSRGDPGRVVLRLVPVTNGGPGRQDADGEAHRRLVPDQEGQRQSGGTHKTQHGVEPALDEAGAAQPGSGVDAPTAMGEPSEAGTPQSTRPKQERRQGRARRTKTHRNFCKALRNDTSNQSQMTRSVGQNSRQRVLRSVTPGGIATAASITGPVTVADSTSDLRAHSLLLDP